MSFQRTRTDKQARNEAQPDTGSNDVEELSISESLLGDVHIDFGQDDQDPVFDEALLQYLDQLPIAPPPTEAKYSPTFVEMVLRDIQTFKEEASIYADRGSLVDFEKMASDYASVNDEYTVEQPRRQQEQEPNDEREAGFPFAYNECLQFPFSEQASSEYSAGLFDPVAFYNDQQDINHTNESLHSMVDVNGGGLQLASTNQLPADYFDLLASLDDQQQQNQLLYDKQQSNFYNLLFEDNSKDFSSWLCFEDDSEVTRFKNGVDPLLASSHQESVMGCSFFPEYPLELANLIDDDRTAARALHDETHPNPPVDTFKDNQKIEEFLTQMERTIDQKIKNVNNNNNNNNINNNNDICKTVHSELLSNNSVPSRIPPFPQQQHHRKQSIKKETSRKPIPAVHISKADFMSTEALAATTALQKKRSSLHDDDDNPEYGASFSDYIIGTSTPIKTNRHLPPVSSSKVLSDVDNQQEVGSSLYFNTRSRSRRSESTVNSSKKQGKTETAKPTFNLTRKRH